MTFANEQIFLIDLPYVYSNSHNDVPLVAQRYETEPLPHTPGAVRPSSLCFVVFCMHMHSFVSLIRRMPSPTFSETAITDRHSDTTIFQLRAHWVRISWSIGSEKSLICHFFIIVLYNQIPLFYHLFTILALFFTVQTISN